MGNSRRTGHGTRFRNQEMLAETALSRGAVGGHSLHWARQVQYRFMYLETPTMPTLFFLCLCRSDLWWPARRCSTVPGQYPGIQAAMDASAPGDTVHVAPGIWFGLYSPTHGLTLCLDYLFTQDSTDINETILDGEYQGTILDLVCENEWFTLCGFTLQHGMGQQVSNSSYCHRAGALQINPLVHAEILDVVFTGNRAPRAASILFQGEVCVWYFKPR